MQLRYSEAMRGAQWNVPLGLVTITGVNSSSLESGLSHLRNSVSVLTAQDLDRVHHRISAFESFFEENGFRCPLRPQWDSIRLKGLPPASAIVQALLVAEMTTGLLMGAQDANAIQGELICDLAAAGEKLDGMREKLECRLNEIVLRDDAAIIASLFQGPDHRTRLKKSTKDIVFFVFSTPKLDADHVRDGVEAIRGLFTGYCSDCHLQTYEGAMPRGSQSGPAS